FFHECAHAIDDISVPDSIGFIKLGEIDYRDVYRDDSGRSLQDAVMEDVKSHLRQSVHQAANETGTELSSFHVERVVEHLVSRERGGMSDPTLNHIYERTLSYYDREVLVDNNYKTINGTQYHTGGAKNEAVDDVFGGATNNKIGSGYMHRHPQESYFNNEYYYWYDKDGKATGAQSSEFFAEHFSHNMTRSPVGQIDQTRQYFTDSCDFVDRMVLDLVP
ncbi:MAG TPA: hypothetical protein GX717_07340, partial [Clostridiaceae bacterium]|nr:hypothetical protein [Clostridiaceae bacterium]